MHKSLLVAALALPLVAADCGGDSTPASPTGCTLRVGNETLVCAAVAYDYSAYDPANTEWGFEIAASRPDGSVLAAVQVFLPARPVLRQPYGWSGTATTVEDGWVTFSTIAPGTSEPPNVTHEARAPFFAGEAGTGAATVSFTGIPAPGATTQQELMAVDGVVDATLVATDGSGATIALHATF